MGGVEKLRVKRMFSYSSYLACLYSVCLAYMLGSAAPGFRTQVAHHMYSLSSVLVMYYIDSSICGVLMAQVK